MRELRRESYPLADKQGTKVTLRDYQASDFGVCRSIWAELTQHHRDIYEDPTIGGDTRKRQLGEEAAEPSGSWR